jgi:hypothetical protein
MRNGSFLAITLVILFAGAGCATRKAVTPPALVVKKDTAARTDAFLQNLLSRYPQYFDTLLQQNSRWQVKIIYTQIDRKANNRPVFTDHFFSLDPKQYFYPASTVKMPVAFLALQKLNELKLPGLDKNTTMITGAAYSGQTSVFNDPQSEDGRPTIANYIRKIFLVSDNDAFNRLYEFLGQEYINNQLHKMGYDSAQVLHHLNVSLSEDQNRHTNPVEFYDTSSRLIYSQPPVFSQLVYQRRHTFLGKRLQQWQHGGEPAFRFFKKEPPCPCGSPFDTGSRALSGSHAAATTVWPYRRRLSFFVPLHVHEAGGINLSAIRFFLCGCLFQISFVWWKRKDGGGDADLQ